MRNGTSFPAVLILCAALAACDKKDSSSEDSPPGGVPSGGVPPLRALPATSSSASGPAPLTVQFRGDASGGLSPYVYAWDLGDGGPMSISQNPSHTYPSARAYNVTLTVTDVAGRTSSASITITVSNASGTSVLEAAAGALAPGQWRELTNLGLTWALIRDPDGSPGHVLEYANQGVYDPVRKQIRYVGGADRSGGAGGSQTKYLIYTLATNQWETGPPPFNDRESHTWAGNAIDPATGDNYVHKARTSTIFKWNGSSWSTLPPNSDFAQDPSVGATWDETRGGLVCWGRGGLYIWRPSSPAAWTWLGRPSGALGPYHMVAHYSRASGNILVGNSFNDPQLAWRLNPAGTITQLNPPAVTLECCGRGGYLSAYDYRTGRFVVADARGSNFWSYDLEADRWSALGSIIPLNAPDPGNVSAIVVPISDFGGVLLYFVYAGVGSTPKAYLYKHH